MIRILATLFAGLFGLVFGSFLNVCLSRWPAGESVVRPRSHCRACSRMLPWWENIPLASWLALRGRCRGCGARIGIRYPLVEFAIGSLWAFQMWQLVPWIVNDQLAIQVAFQVEPYLAQVVLDWVLVALAVLDFEHLWLPDLLTLSGVALGVAHEFLWATLLFHQPHCDYVGLGPIGLAAKAILSAAIAAGLILLIRWLYWLIRRREGLGLGDAKLMAMLAAWLGLPGALLSLFIGVVLGAVAATALLLRRKPVQTQQKWSAAKLPLGTFLCIGGIVSALWGQQILAAYWRWSGF